MSSSRLPEASSSSSHTTQRGRRDQLQPHSDSRSRSSNPTNSSRQPALLPPPPRGSSLGACERYLSHNDPRSKSPPKHTLKKKPKKSSLRLLLQPSDYDSDYETSPRVPRSPAISSTMSSPVKSDPTAPAAKSFAGPNTTGGHHDHQHTLPMPGLSGKPNGPVGNILKGPVDKDGNLKDAALMVGIKLDLEAEVHLTARVRGDIMVGLF